MSLLSSWLLPSNTWSSVSRSRAASEHELPLWHQPPPSKMASSTSSQLSVSVTSPPPPPLVLPTPTAAASIHASTARLKQNRALPDSVVLLRRQEKQLHDHLQDLLYQQDEALRLAAPTQHDDDDDDHDHDHHYHQDAADLSGSATPTASRLADSKRQPPAEPHRLSRSPNNSARNHKLGVRAVRKAIRSAIRQLAAVKAEESRLLDEDRAGNEAVVRRLDGWVEQRDGLTAHIQAIEHGDAEAHAAAAALRDEARAAEAEVRELEDRLRAARARHRQLLAELAERENSVQSRLSSYRASLSILDADIDAFLRGSAAAARLPVPPKRRTLAMARDRWEEEQRSIEKQRRRSDKERDALERGAVVWADVVHRIADFERHIAAATRQGDGDGDGTGASEDPTAGARELVAHLADTIHHVESQLELAEDKGWRLLVACIGAELSALHAGRRMLEAMLRAAGDVSPTIEREKSLGDVDVDFQPSSGGGHGGGEALANDGRAILPDGSESRAAAAAAPSPATVTTLASPARQPRPDYRHDHGTDEDEPDPELLISHQDTDDDDGA